MNKKQLEIDKILKNNNKELYKYIDRNNDNLKMLLKNGLDINRQQAVDIDNIKNICIEYLIDYNIDPLNFEGVKVDELKTYQTFKKSKENLERVKRFNLLNKQRGIDTIFSEPTLLHIAIKNKDFIFAKNLIEAGANINARYDDTGVVTYSSMMYTCEMGRFYAGNKTIFCEALKAENNEFIYYLLDLGVEIEPTLFYQTHPMEYLLRYYPRYRNTEVIRKILKDVKWYHNHNIIDELHPATIEGIKLCLKDNSDEKMKLFNSPLINAIEKIIEK